MSWIEGSILLFGGLVAVMGLGLPVAFAFLALNVVGALLFLGGEAGLAQLARNAVQSITSFSLTPIPFFVLMGEVLFHSGVALKAIDAFALIIRRVPGRLSVIAIVAGTVFSAISGSTIATTALLGSLMLPTMLARGYDPRMAIGPILGLGRVDMLIPPSALTVLLTSLAGHSIAELLLGGIVTGLVLNATYLAFIIVGHHVLAGAELLRRGQWSPRRCHGAGAFGQCRRDRHAAGPLVPRLLRRSGQHDADHAAVLHAAGAALRHRLDLVRRAVPDLHAARLADAAVRAAAVHHERRRAAIDHDAAGACGSRALYRGRLHRAGH